MNCPNCGKAAVLINTTRKITTAAGVGAGGYLAASGAAIGSAILPGLGTLAGGLIGILIGAAGGGLAGHTVGKLLDENVVRTYRCPTCNHTWRT